MKIGVGLIHLGNIGILRKWHLYNGHAHTLSIQRAFQGGARVFKEKACKLYSVCDEPQSTITRPRC